MIHFVMSRTGADPFALAYGEHCVALRVEQQALSGCLGFAVGADFSHLVNTIFLKIILD